LHLLSGIFGFLIPSGKILPHFSSIWLFSFGANNTKAVHPERTDNDNLFKQLLFHFSFRPTFDRLKVWVAPLQAVFQALSLKRFRSMDIFCGHKLSFF